MLDDRLDDRLNRPLDCRLDGPVHAARRAVALTPT
jgi:hypothetical protein